MKSLTNVNFWAASLERALKTFAISLAGLWGSDEVFNLLNVDWASSLGIAAGMALLSLVTSVASIPAGNDPTSPSLTNAK